MFLFKQTLKSYIFIVFVFLFLSCQEGKEHIAPAINPRDSVAVMISYGVNTLVSDSGLIKYRIVAERWEVNQEKNHLDGFLIKVFSWSSLMRSSMLKPIFKAIPHIIMISQRFGS